MELFSAPTLGFFENEKKSGFWNALNYESHWAVGVFGKKKPVPLNIFNINESVEPCI